MLFRLSTLFSLVFTLSHNIGAMDNDNLPFTIVPSEIINTYITKQLKHDDLIPLICACKQFNETIIRNWRCPNIAPKDYAYVAMLMNKNLINLSRICIIQLPNYDTDSLLKAAKAFGLKELAIECCSGQFNSPTTGLSKSSCCPPKDSCNPLRISPFFNGNTKIQKLSFAGRNLKIDVNDLCNTLREKCSLTSLTFHNTDISVDDIFKINQSVNNNVTIITPHNSHTKNFC
jgi:hypothetical protein